MECNSTYEYVSNLIKTSNVSSFGQVLELQHLASSGNVILTVIDNNSNRFHAEVYFDPVTNQISPPKISPIKTTTSTTPSTTPPEEIEIPILSGISDVDITILNFLDDDSLTKACQVNKYTSELCKKEELWQRRIEKLDPELLLLKTPEKSWRNFYISILRFPYIISSTIKEGNIALLRWIYKEYEMDEYYDYNGDIEIAVDNGQLEILKFIVKNMDYIDNDFLYNVNWDYEELVMLPNILEILEVLSDNGLIIISDRDLFLEAMTNNRLDIMKLLHRLSNNSIDSDDEDEMWIQALSEIIEKDYLEMYLWLMDHKYLDIIELGFDSTEEAKQYYASVAVQHNSENILNWFILHGIFPTTGINDVETLNRLEKLGANFDFRLANDATEKGNIEVLELLLQRHYNPTAGSVNTAIIEGFVDVLEILRKYGVIILTTSENMNLAAEKNQIDVLNWGAKNNIFPNTDGANRAVEQNAKDALNWMGERGIAPNQIGANYAMKNDYNDLVKWMISFGVYPNQHHVNWAARNNRLELLKILGEIHILPDSEGADWALDFCHYNVLDYLTERKIFPTRGEIIKSLKNFEGYGNEKLREQVKSWLYQ